MFCLCTVQTWFSCAVREIQRVQSVNRRRFLALSSSVSVTCLPVLAEAPQRVWWNILILHHFETIDISVLLTPPCINPMHSSRFPCGVEEPSRSGLMFLWLMSVVFQVPSIPQQVMCPLAMRPTSLQLVGPSLSGGLFIPGCPWWSYISRCMHSEGKQRSDCTLSISSCCLIDLSADACPVCNRSWAQSLLPYAFYFCWLANMVLNMIWLLLWDREYVNCFFLFIYYCI